MHDRRAAVGDAEVVVTHVQHVPQLRAFVFLRVSTGQSLEALMEPHFRGDAHRLARKLPTKIRQPKSADAERPDVIYCMGPRQGRARNEPHKLVVANVQCVRTVGDMQCRDS